MHFIKKFRGDCGIYVMLLMHHWNGSLVKNFDHNEALKFRKLTAFKLINSELNESAVNKIQPEEVQP